MQKIKEFLRSKRARVTVVTTLALAVMCMSCFAADGETAHIDTAGITAAFINGFNSMVTDSVAMISALVPIALSLAGVVFLIRKAMSWFKSMAK